MTEGRITPAQIVAADDAYQSSAAHFRATEATDPGMVEWGPFRALLAAETSLHDLKARYRAPEGIGTMEMRAHIERARART